MVLFLTDGHPEGVQFVVGSVRYIALGEYQIKLRLPEACLITVIDAKENDGPLNQPWLKGYLDRLDDGHVYLKDKFLAGLIFTNIKSGYSDVTPEAHDYLKRMGNNWLEIISDAKTGQELRPGPYIYMGKALRKVYRLQSDTQRAFMAATRLPPSEIQFQTVKAGGSLYQCLDVAVPHRMATPDLPLSTMRIAVKDCYFLKGLKNSLCNSAYYDVMPPAEFTATVVDTLIKNGALVLGLTKLSTLIGREEPTESVDFQTSFNPRGDGYQSPAGSSSGSAVAVAAYDWIDCAIGTDTSGSGRRPALANGVWQFRPSHNRKYLNGLVQTYERFDTPCAFARKFSVLKHVAQRWLDAQELGHSSSKYSIVYPLDYLPVKNQQQMMLIDGFVEDMKNVLSAEIRRVSIRDMWRTNHPPGTCESLDEYLEDVVARTFYYAYYHAFDNFRKKYGDRYHQPPYVIPFVHRRWEKGATVSEQDHHDATSRMEIYRQWLLDNIFHVDGKETLIILPIANVEPNYRDEPSPSPDNQSALDQLFLSPILGAPDISIPIGQSQYHSKITEREEYLPVVVNVVGAPGADLNLLDCIETVMKSTNRPTTVLTGKKMF